MSNIEELTSVRRSRQTVGHYLKLSAYCSAAILFASLCGPTSAFERLEQASATDYLSCGSSGNRSAPSEGASKPQPNPKRQPAGPIFRQSLRNAPDRRVALLQSVLADKAVYASVIDGLFGSQTVSAVKSFQANSGMPVDGMVGIETGKAMGLPFWDASHTRKLTPPFRDSAKYPDDIEFRFRSLIGIGNFFSSVPDARYSSSDTLTRRALRTNNPGAINISRWQRDSMKGYVGCTLPDRYGNQTAVYETPEFGVAAWGFLLRKIYFGGKKDKVTIGAIVDKYRGDNPRDAYIDGYKKYSGGKLAESYEIDLYDNRQLALLAIAAYSHEFGSWYPLTGKQLLAGFSITDEYIDSGVNDEVIVAPEEMDPGRYIKHSDAERPAPAPPPPAARSATTDAAVRHGLQQLVETEGGPPGAIATLYRDGRLTVLSAGRANVSSDVAPAVNQYMRIASVSKAFNGAIALHLVQTGRIGLDETIGQHLPGLPAAWSAITLRHMLNHTSGLPDYLRSDGLAKQVATDPQGYVEPRKIIDWVRNDPLEFAPGSKYAYSNTDNIVVGLIAEEVTSKPYEALLQEMIFGPANLAQTSFPTTEIALPTPYIHGYVVEPGSQPEDVTNFVSPSGAWASGAIVSTPENLSTFIRADLALKFFGAAEQQEQMQFISGDSSPPGPGTNEAGLGLFRYTTPCGVVYGHTGNFPGYTQWAASNADGTRSVTTTLNAAEPTGALIEHLREVQAQAVCALLGH
ncbi:serine hydrolase [Mesorhizobium sp.]|uniref:serine hydrolase n=1 Tax=Mesorhizobium sp. TaxID=1871066 RepID=UPI000FE824F8|nr:serine hydrolase [Mesorhizobium sp.]RWO52561.1 MAG: serine hydrolase [Mesorhizobium sp.]TIN22664.1 MAG: serine hydrolase [Mesorhizobium sp.]TIN35411.1 MAG: serine hydrolase [Mesorhizobium sp.]TJU79047.1 MAG: serine hydrolase [Mesorhizobium sp.]TJU84987.1 MAG: serine hydrolase [Mesorhizobium sp.]